MTLSNTNVYTLDGFLIGLSLTDSSKQLDLN